DEISGLLYPPGDFSALIQRIERLLIDIEFREELGRNARRVIEMRYTWKDNAERMLTLCNQVVN
ncbi:MAG: glycosyltransferase family 1 protein, partial [Candidatus Electrothrix sp. ATG2]|nr:glycosyltransferase family 1 protein [Candidatus Electrothrix sp. ATG2]